MKCTPAISIFLSLGLATAICADELWRPVFRDRVLVEAVNSSGVRAPTAGLTFDSQGIKAERSLLITSPTLVDTPGFANTGCEGQPGKYSLVQLLKRRITNRSPA